MFKLEFDPANLPLAQAIGKALYEYGRGAMPSIESDALAGAAVTAPSVEEQIDATLDVDGGPEAEQQEELSAATMEEEHKADADIAKSEEAERRIDHNGVLFDPEYCGEAVDPFYKSGKQMGQWKKRKGVDQDAYDAWYAAELQALKDEEGDESAIDVGQAFGQPQQQEVSAPTQDYPQDVGAFMQWLSERQAAGHVTQQDIDVMWPSLGFTMTDMFPPTSAEKVGRLCAEACTYIDQLLASRS